MNQVKIPTRCDDPIHVLVWSLDELAPMFIGLVAGMAVGQAMIGVLIGLAVTNFYKKYRDSHADGYLIHIAYWAGFLLTKSRLFVNPYIRRFIP